MSGETSITLCGNLVDEVELRFVPNGAAVAKFRMASTPRKFNRDTNSWEDDKEKSLFLTVSVWRQQAENCAETLTKGMRVVVQGQLSQRSYEDREGVKRTVYEVTAEEVAPSLRNATAKVTKSGGGQGKGAYQQARQAQGAASAEDPWASSASGQSQAGGWDDSPPF